MNWFRLPSLPARVKRLIRDKEERLLHFHLSRIQVECEIHQLEQQLEFLSDWKPSCNLTDICQPSQPTTSATPARDHLFGPSPTLHADSQGRQPKKPVAS